VGAWAGISNFKGRVASVCCWCRVTSGLKIDACGSAGLWLSDSRREAHFLLDRRKVGFLMPNVRANL
jgi:hypothetical protein